MNIARIKETCIYVKDLEKTKDFYAGKMMLEIISHVKERHIFFRAGESVLLCFIAAITEKDTILPPHGSRGCIHFAFEVSASDYTEVLQKMKDAGIIILHEHCWDKNIRSFYFHNPDHNLVEIIEEGLWHA